MNCVFVYVICSPTPLAIDVGTGLGLSAYEVSSCLKECTFCSEYTVSLLVEERVFFRVIAFTCCLCSHIVKTFKFDTHTPLMSLYLETLFIFMKSHTDEYK